MGGVFFSSPITSHVWLMLASPVPSPSPQPSPAPSSMTAEVAQKVAENVLTNVLTIVVLPLVLPVACAAIGLVIHSVRGDRREWWESVRDFLTLAAWGGRASGFGGVVRYWLGLMVVLATGRLADTGLLGQRADPLDGSK